MRPSATPSHSGPSIAPATRLGAVPVTVADLDRMRSFYERTIGLRTLERDGRVVRLGAEESRPLVELVGAPDAPPAPRRATGLFHQALLMPTRSELARSMKRVVESGWRFTGASDHLVSEALYLDDPEGNGIEIYRDRPRSEWRTTPEDEIEMATMPLDLDGVMSELPGDPDGGAPPGTIMGHVHLRVSDIPPAEAFYSGLIGFEVTVRGYSGALFVSAGGYHHHVGMNTWGSAGAPPPPLAARGLRRYEVLLPSREALDAVRGRLAGGGAGSPTCEHGEGRFAGWDSKRGASKWRCPSGECKPASQWVNAYRLHPLIPRETPRWRKHYKGRASVEREFGRLKNEWALLPLRVRGLERVQLHADLTILAKLASALARAGAAPVAG